jgi:outer membrane immunogenic protein
LQKFGTSDEEYLLSTVAITVTAASSSAIAADMAAQPYTKAPAIAPAPIYNWDGF